MLGHTFTHSYTADSVTSARVPACGAASSYAIGKADLRELSNGNLRARRLGTLREARCHDRCQRQRQSTSCCIDTIRSQKSCPTILLPFDIRSPDSKQVLSSSVPWATRPSLQDQTISFRRQAQASPLCLCLSAEPYDEVVYRGLQCSAGKRASLQLDILSVQFLGV